MLRKNGRLAAALVAAVFLGAGWKSAYCQSAARSARLTVHAVSGDLVDGTIRLETITESSLASNGMVSFRGFDANGLELIVQGKSRMLFSSLIEGDSLDGFPIGQWAGSACWRGRTSLRQVLSSDRLRMVVEAAVWDWPSVERSSNHMMARSPPPIGLV